MVGVCKTLVAAIGIVGLSGAAQAQLQERDWLSPGDGLLTYDPIAGLEYLDISETLATRFSGPLLEDRYQGVVAELAPGGTFEGFRVATATEAQALFDNVGLVPGAIDFATNGEAATTLLDLIGETESFGTRRDLNALLATTGVVPNGAETRNQLFLFADPADAGVQVWFGVAGGLSTASEPFPNPDYRDLGVLLVRPAIPEPSALTMALCVLLSRWAPRTPARPSA